MHICLHTYAPTLIRNTIDRFGEKYPSLKATVLKKLCEAIEETKAYTTCYGGLMGIQLFGAKSVDAFVLPIAQEYWHNWNEALDKNETNLGKRHHIFQCQQALLVSSQLLGR